MLELCFVDVEDEDFVASLLERSMSAFIVSCADRTCHFTSQNLRTKHRPIPRAPPLMMAVLVTSRVILDSAEVVVLSLCCSLLQRNRVLKAIDFG